MEDKYKSNEVRPKVTGLFGDSNTGTSRQWTQPFRLPVKSIECSGVDGTGLTAGGTSRKETKVHGCRLVKSQSQEKQARSRIG